MILERQKQISSKISRGFCLKKVSRSQCREVSRLPKGNGAENLERPRQLEFAGQDTKEKELHRDKTL